MEKEILKKNFSEMSTSHYVRNIGEIVTFFKSSVCSCNSQGDVMLVAP